MKEGVRINKYLALCGLGSRRQCESLVLEGKVRLNGTVLADLGARVGEEDTVLVSGKKCSPPQAYTYIAFHKPKGCICSRRDDRGRDTLYKWLPKKLHHLSYVGRLDYNSHGLLLLTNHGDLSRSLTDPKNKLPRVYRVVLHRKLEASHKLSLERGGRLENGERFLPVNIGRIQEGGSAVEVTLFEGKNREIRRMFAGLGYQVEDLKRIAFGSLRLKGLAPGAYRFLSQQEITGLASKGGQKIGLQKIG